MPTEPFWDWWGLYQLLQGARGLGRDGAGGSGRELTRPVLSLQEQLRQLYPRLKVLAFGTTPETTLHAYFPSFLSRATPNCPPDMKREVSLPRGPVVSGTVPQLRWSQTWECAGSGTGLMDTKDQASVTPQSPPYRRVELGGVGPPQSPAPHCPLQLLRCLHECLSTDPLSFSVWRQLYTKHLSQSR